MSCVYLREKQPGRFANLGNTVYGCAQFEQCTTVGEPKDMPSCTSGCKTRLTYDDEKFATKFEDTLRITDRELRPTKALHNLLSRGVAFLVAGGPSAKTLPLDKLSQRGVFSLAVNNMAGSIRPNAFVCSDPPLKFHHGIWLDPNVMKFIPTVKVHRRRGKLKQKVGDVFSPLVINGKEWTVSDCPNVWGYDRRIWIEPDDTFFAADGATWGNNDAGVKKTSGPKTLMTMLIALRLLYYLGARTIYLVGVDFEMRHGVGLHGNYAFGQGREDGTVDSNNAQFAIANHWLTQMADKGVFKRFGVDIFNCNATSKLRAFPHVPFDLAMRDALKDYPVEPFDLEGWYEKK